MRLRIDLRMDYAIGFQDPVLLAITPAQATGQTVLSDTLKLENATWSWSGGASETGQRIWVRPHGAQLRLQYLAEVAIHRTVTDLESLAADRWDTMRPEVFNFLRPSRYCPSDLFGTFVRGEFGHLAGGAKIAAIRDWTARTIAYVPGSSRHTTTAIDTFLAREGVCRDQAHLVCSLARAAGIPARYTTGYGPDVLPQDFHAVAEVWLDGGWHVVDPTGMSTASELAIIGSGRDAADMAFMETEAWSTPVAQNITVAIV